MKISETLQSNKLEKNSVTGRTFLRYYFAEGLQVYYELCQNIY